MRHIVYTNDLENSVIDGCPHDLFYLSPVPPDFDGLYIQMNRAGIVLRTPPDFSKQRSDLFPYCLLFCVMRGSGSVTFHGTSRVVHEGDIFIIGANEAHSYTSDPHDPMGLVWVEFCGGDSAHIVQHICDKGGYIYGKGIFAEVLTKCTSLLYQREQQGANISRILYDILMCLSEQAETEAQYATPTSRILSYIDDNLDHPLTLTEVASVFGYHPAYFCSLFSRTMHTTFSKYVTERKLSHACYLLEATDWPIARIAQELGFFDTRHFIKPFKAVKAVSPAAYRTQIKKR